jgi:acyl-CoA synthetase (AMP-forming)/AMP-acid ligase II
VPEEGIESLLGQLAVRHGDRVALTDGTRRVSYRELERWALGLSVRLRREGIGPGERVIVVAHDSPGFVAAFFGVLMSGASVACLTPEATPRELQAMAAVARPRAAVLETDDGGRDYGRALAEHLPRHTEWIRGGGPTWPPSDDRTIVPRRPEDPALLAFTSGSTGTPKAALHNAATLMNAAQLYVHDVLDDRPATLLSTLPLYHLGGMVLILLPALIVGGVLVLTPRFTSSGAVEAIERDRVDVLMAIPTMVELILRRERIEERDLKSLQTVVLGGAPVSNTLVRTITTRLGAGVRVGYGTTECPGFWCITRADTPIGELGPFVGWPAPGYRLSIRDDQNQPVAPGKLGEICVRSAFSMIEYVENPEATVAAIDGDGWLHTGDTGMLRDDRGLLILGRVKDMYIRGGFNVYPREIEEALLQHPAVSAAAVHGVTDEVLGERGCAWVVPKRGAILRADDVRDFLAGLLSPHKLPDVIRIVDGLPMTPVGKVDKRALATSLQAGGEMHGGMGIHRGDRQ